MILDMFCIVASYFLRHINSDVSEQMKKQILKRYTNLHEDKPPKQNKLYSTFSDREAMKRILSDTSFCEFSPDYE